MFVIVKSNTRSKNIFFLNVKNLDVFWASKTLLLKVKIREFSSCFVFDVSLIFLKNQEALSQLVYKCCIKFVYKFGIKILQKMANS